MIMAQNEKNLPINVWLGEDSHWNSEPQDSKGYVGYVRKDYHAQALLHVLQKGKEFGKMEVIEKIKSLINGWSYDNSTEAKYKIEEYKELIEFINEEDKG